MPISKALPGVTNSEGAHALACPLCRGEVIRTWRRPVDRFTTLFMPVHRYRCEDFSCQWEGNFRTGHISNQAGKVLASYSSGKGVSALLVVEVLIVVVATLFIAGFSTSNIWSDLGTSTTRL